MLAYEGDPMLYHSMSMVIVADSNIMSEDGGQISVNDLIVYERMANSNKKSLIVAYKNGMGSSSGQLEFCEIKYVNKINRA